VQVLTLEMLLGGINSPGSLLLSSRQSIMGLLGFYRMFVRNFSEKVLDIYRTINEEGPVLLK